MSKFLTYGDRLEIQKGLKEQLSFGKIAAIIEKDRTTVSKEIRKYSLEQKTGYSGYSYNSCKYRKNCTQKNICPLGCSKQSKYKCRLCTLCNSICEDYEEEVCTTKTKPPYVCNGCGQLQKCSLKKMFYHAEEAHIRFQENISDCRTGIYSL